MTLPTRREAREEQRRSAEPTERPRRRRLLLWIGIPVLILVALVGWLGFKALTVKGSLEAAQASLQQAQDGGDIAAAIDVVSREAGTAASAANDPIWRAAEVFPWVGDNLRGVRVASEALDVVANDIGKPVLDMQGDGEGKLLARALPIIESGATSLAPLTAELASLASNEALIGPVKGGVVQISDVLSGVQPVLDLLPGLLGADGAKNYLLVFQNNAESLPLGGSAASETMIRADAGDLEITGQASSGTFDADRRDIGIEISEPLRNLWGNNYGVRVNMSTTRPDWPSAAQMVAAFWNRTVDDTRIDGAISIDPIALSRILVATGPVTVPGPDGEFQLDSANALEVLLSKSYAWWDAYTPEGAVASDAFFAAVASKVFEAVSSGSMNLKDMAWAVNESISQGSIMAWMSDPAQQSLIEESGKLSGILPTDNTTETAMGVYFRDASASKIDYYLNTAIDASMTCADGVTRVTAKATMKLDITQEAAEALPAYVQSFRNGSEYYSKHVFVYAPPGMEVESMRVEGDWVKPFREGNMDLGRVVAPFESRMPPGSTVTVEVTFIGSGDFGPLSVRSNPMVKPTQVAITDECN
ncbi:DUF4012 domain-containing protein [Microbacterium sp. PA5]|uniref:DUF4012 domain-containing protein n=1 Tax=Microbacterium sp. PA5 TaxID=3416654 RepID=UPI003CF8600B